MAVRILLAVAADSGRMSLSTCLCRCPSSGNVLMVGRSAMSDHVFVGGWPSAEGAKSAIMPVPLVWIRYDGAVRRVSPAMMAVIAGSESDSESAPA